jgi:plasmid replication initiation protein
MEKSRHVRKSNLFVEGRYRFGVSEQRILLSIISKIKISDTDFSSYRLPWSYLKKITANNLKTIDDVHACCEKLKNKTILIKDGSLIHGYGFLSGWTVEPGKWVDFRIDPAMRDMLLNLLHDGRFTLYRLECILSLGSAYSIRLYEILKAHEWKKQPVELELDALKWQMGVESGSKADTRFDFFRSSILDRAKSDLEKHTDIKFTYRKILECRRVVALQVHIKENKKYQCTVAAAVAKTDSLKDGDRVVIAGQEYVVEGDSVRMPDGVLPLGRLNEMYKKGKIEKL